MGERKVFPSFEWCFLVYVSMPRRANPPDTILNKFFFWGIRSLFATLTTIRQKAHRKSLLFRVLWRRKLSQFKKHIKHQFYGAPESLIDSFLSWKKFRCPAFRCLQRPTPGMKRTSTRKPINQAEFSDSKSISNNKCMQLFMTSRGNLPMCRWRHHSERNKAAMGMEIVYWLNKRRQKESKTARPVESHTESILCFDDTPFTTANRPRNLMSLINSEKH